MSGFFKWDLGGGDPGKDLDRHFLSGDSSRDPDGDSDRHFLSGDSGFDGDSDRDFRVLDFDGDFNKDSEREFNSDLDEDFVTLEFLPNFTSNCASRL